MQVLECNEPAGFWSIKETISTHLDLTPGQTIDGADVEVTLAKPVDKDHYRQQRAVAKLMQMANQYQHFPSVLPDISSINGMQPFNNQMPGLVYPPPFIPPTG